jgi:beta-lactamase regulating signal transducer with metallopeptidase domain
MNLYGSLLITFIIIIRAVAVNKLPKKTFVVLWLIIISRLLIPYTMPQIINVYPVVAKVNEISGERFINNQAAQSNVTDVSEIMPTIPNNNNSQTENMPAKEKTDKPVYMIVWVAGIFAAGAFFIQPHILYSRKYRAALPVENDYIDSWVNSHRLHRKYKVMLSDEIISPFTYGIFKPVIILPKTIDMNNREIIDYILTHEYIHIKRFDIVLKWLSVSTLCVNWFNPFVWVMYILANRDIELACDEGVIRLKGEINKKSYALTLLDMEAIKNSFNPLVNYFNKNSLKERRTAIIKTKKITILSIILAFVLIISSGLILFSSCEKKAEVTDPDEVASVDEDTSTTAKEFVGETVIIAGEAYSVDITRLDLGTRTLTDDDIKDIGKLKNFIVLDLDFNSITDISALSGLIKRCRLRQTGNIGI